MQTEFAIHGIAGRASNALAVLGYDVRRKPRLRKKVDEVTQVSCNLGRGVIREEVWVDTHNAVARYNLAFINHQIHSGDNGQHHRHFMGKLGTVAFWSYEKLLREFLDEIREISKWG